MNPSPSQGVSPSRRPKRHHHKSRLGCRTCKQRRVKCDEAKPACARCVSFGAVCEYLGVHPIPRSDSALFAVGRSSSSSDDDHLSQPCSPDRRRRPGRPRRDWAAAAASLTLSRDPTGLGHPGGGHADEALTMSLWQDELLHHFSLHTAPSLVGTRIVGHPVVQFWRCNAPQIGLAHSYALHLTLSLAAFHRRHLARAHDGRDEERRYLDLATRHLSRGVVGMHSTLPSMSRANCGALLVASLLVCFCAFATGPTGSTDLLLCEMGGAGPGRILSLARGWRLIAESFDASTLYTGLLRPLAPEVAGSLDDSHPLCVSLGFPRLDWVPPLQRLRQVVALDTSSSGSPTCCLRALQHVETIYEAIYGDDSGAANCPAYFKIALVFLYLVEDRFVALVQAGEPIALLVLAYYAPLLEADPKDWKLHGWSKHIVASIGDRLAGTWYAELLAWPSRITQESTLSPRSCASD
ncbi:hypothetical protein VTK73DRAFT_4567 [Phialemonium thermophilum]|uniref:Zn(2)-C6 fungal-type domain-containing protein n=1 Tax=Phialemonium thermophilum TaxID=223376 RepID=A0ABR3WSK9_9PEZI